jgi:hypothetical protein
MATLDSPEDKVQSREQVRAWLLAYAWIGTPEERAAEVECILAQDGWQHLDAVTEHYRGMAADDAQISEAAGFALSALYECHDGPHLPTCRSKVS